MKNEEREDTKRKRETNEENQELCEQTRKIWKMTEEIKTKDRLIKNLRGDLEEMQRKVEEMQEIEEAIGNDFTIYRKGLEKEHKKQIRQMKIIDKIYIEAEKGSKGKGLEAEEVCKKIVQIIVEEGDD